MSARAKLSHAERALGEEEIEEPHATEGVTERQVHVRNICARGSIAAQGFGGGVCDVCAY